MDRFITNLECALPHFLEAARIHRGNNHLDSAEKCLRKVAATEENTRNAKAVAETRG